MIDNRNMKKKKIIITSIASILYIALVSASFMLEKYYAYYSLKNTIFGMLSWITTSIYLPITYKLFDRWITRLIFVTLIAILTAVIIFIGLSRIQPLPAN